MSKQNSLCFPCLEKVRTKFPVPWPPCFILYFAGNIKCQGGEGGGEGGVGEEEEEEGGNFKFQVVFFL